MTEVVVLRSTELTSGSVIYTGKFKFAHDICDCRVGVYTAAGVIISGATGSFEVEVEAMPGQWMKAGAGDSTILAGDCGPDATYSIPVFGRQSVRGRIKITEDITRADYFEAQFHLS